ncbi:MAG: hypothetical protein JXD22_04945 [Sedimentisphaerales bacterium]|nr:hypothetical protein [Sedimentisphaerales bacterium]
MAKLIRKTINLDSAMCKQLEAYGKDRSCASFSEIIRDLVRVVLKPKRITHKEFSTKGRGIQSKNGGKSLSQGGE